MDWTEDERGVLTCALLGTTHSPQLDEDKEGCIGTGACMQARPDTDAEVQSWSAAPMWSYNQIITY